MLLLATHSTRRPAQYATKLLAKNRSKNHFHAHHVILSFTENALVSPCLKYSMGNLVNSNIGVVNHVPKISSHYQHWMIVKSNKSALTVMSRVAVPITRKVFP